MNNDTKKIQKSFKIIVISNDSEDGMRVNVHLKEYKRKHWYSLKYSWCVISGTGTWVDDRDMVIQDCLVEWMAKYPDIKILNTSTRIKFSTGLLKRKVLIDKTSNGKTRKPRPIKAKRVVCVDDGTLFYYNNSDSEELRGGLKITTGLLYWAWEHHSNEDRLESFEKFLRVKTNYGSIEILPKRLFKEI